jgi:bifunctional oligoribonuclease and PAP phosphatase NrnA
MKLNEVISKISEFNNIGITYHLSPDGDSLGSSLALMIGLKQLNKNAYIISKENLPELYSYLPYSNMINNNSGLISEETQCVIVLDCSNFQRISADIDKNTKKFTLLNIDHHISNDLYGDVNYIDSSASAVGEIIYNILVSLNIKIDKEIAECLYTSIITDNGSFRFSNTTANTHNISGQLINCGINFSEIHRKIFENKKFNRVKLYGKVIENMYVKGHICIMKLTKAMLKEYDFDFSEDTSDIINIGMEIGEVEVCALIKEVENDIKISLRSKSKVDVSKVAGKFAGGGHVRAAGLTLNTDILDAESIIINAIENELI